MAYNWVYFMGLNPIPSESTGSVGNHIQRCGGVKRGRSISYFVPFLKGTPMCQLFFGVRHAFTRVLTHSRSWSLSI